MIAAITIIPTPKTIPIIVPASIFNDAPIIDSPLQALLITFLRMKLV